jgi:hypothetical protein
MDGFMPSWQFYRDELNTLPVRHEIGFIEQLPWLFHGHVISTSDAE